MKEVCLGSSKKSGLYRLPFNPFSFKTKIFLKTHTIHSLKYGDLFHYEWKARLAHRGDRHFLFYQPPPRRVIHHTRQRTFIFNSPGLQLFWKEWPFSISVSRHRHNRLAYYCNVHEPIRWNGVSLSFVDLDLDVVKQPHDVPRILDREEFEKHRISYSYPSAYARSVPAVATFICRHLSHNPFLGKKVFLRLFERPREAARWVPQMLRSMGMPPRLICAPDA